MASTQCERKETEQSRCELKAKILEEKFRVSKELANKSVPAIDDNNKSAPFGKLQHVMTTINGTLFNHTAGPLNILDSKEWTIKQVEIKKYPNPLQLTHNRSGDAFFIKSGIAYLQGGLKAAVAYAGKGSFGTECVWLLAWGDTDASGRTIYAECGPKRKFNKIDWSSIEKKLGEAGMVADAHDEETGTRVYAKIVQTRACPVARGYASDSTVGAAFIG